LEELIDDPGVNRLRAHHELSGNAELSQEEAEEFCAFNDIKLPIIPQLAFTI